MFTSPPYYYTFNGYSYIFFILFCKHIIIDYMYNASYTWAWRKIDVNKKPTAKVMWSNVKNKLRGMNTKNKADCALSSQFTSFPYFSFSSAFYTFFSLYTWKEGKSYINLSYFLTCMLHQHIITRDNTFNDENSHGFIRDMKRNLNSYLHYKLFDRKFTLLLYIKIHSFLSVGKY